MGWRRGEVWLDSELWLAEPVPVVAGFPAPPLPRDAVPPGLSASRHRREVSARERRARRSRASAMVLSPAVALALAALQADARPRGAVLAEDPPSLTFRFDDGLLTGLHPTTSAPKRVHRPAVEAMPKIAWHHATSVGLPYGGRLMHGTQLPVSGPDWVTWDPITDSSPNLPDRLYGNERTIRTVISVIHAYRATHPHAPRVVIGDISWRHGGPMDDHLSHQNGLDVDVYYPRRDHELRAPTTHGQIDRGLAQDLLDRFVAAGAQMIFVGFSSGLHGPSGVVMPYPNHEYHMHVRFPRPAGR
jgi:hypothetical protein